jgi:hypothetical protein
MSSSPLNSQPSTLNGASASRAALPADPLPQIHPAVKSLRLLQRLQACTPLFETSFRWLAKWWRDMVDRLNRAAEAAQAIDDPLERRRAKIEQALANDPPALRREILAALDEVHARSESRAAELRVQLPLCLHETR